MAGRPGAHRVAGGVFLAVLDEAEMADGHEFGWAVFGDLGHHAVAGRVQKADRVALLPGAFEPRAFAERAGPLFVGGGLKHGGPDALARGLDEGLEMLLFHGGSPQRLLPCMASSFLKSSSGWLGGKSSIS
ncbi:hypothetical protein D9M69_643480 [compost metagenome]